VDTAENVAKDIRAAVAQLREHVKAALGRYDKAYQHSMYLKIPGADAGIRGNGPRVTLEVKGQLFLKRIQESGVDANAPTILAEIEHLRQLAAGAQGVLQECRNTIALGGTVSAKPADNPTPEKPIGAKEWASIAKRLREADRKVDKAVAEAWKILPRTTPRGQQVATVNESEWRVSPKPLAPDATNKYPFLQE
jgi:hypothetical protein